MAVSLYGPIPAVRMGAGRMDNKADLLECCDSFDIGEEETEGSRRLWVSLISPLRSVSPGLQGDLVDAPSAISARDSLNVDTLAGLL